MQNHRSIPLAVLRDFALTQTELSSCRAAAQEAGVGRTTLHNFINSDSKPHPRIRRLIVLWYLRKKGEPAVIDVMGPYAAAPQTLSPNLPGSQRGNAEGIDSVAA